MTLPSATLIASLLALPSTGAMSPAPTDEDGAALMDRVDATLGSPEARAPVKNLRRRAVVSWVGMPGTGTLTEVYAPKARGHVVSEFEGFGRFETGADGEVVWEKSTMGARVHRGEAAAQVLRRFGRARSCAWRELYASARQLGVEDVEGRACHRIELQPRSARGVDESEAAPKPDVWFIETETLHPRRVLAPGVGFDGSPTEMRQDLQDWKAVEGILYPRLVRTTMSGFTMVAKYESTEHGVELAEDRFTPDEDVLRALAEKPPANRDGDLWIEELGEQHFAAIRLTCSRDSMQRTLTVILQETTRHISLLGVTASGPPTVRYYNSGEELEIEGGMPVAKPVEARGRVESSTLPAGRALMAWHVGPYDTCDQTHARIAARIAAEGLVQTGAPWEEYWTDPGLEPDPQKWRTRIVYPIQ